MLPEHNTSPHTINVSTTTFVKAVLIILALGFLWFIRDILAMFFAALLLAALIDPFADFLESRKIPRGLGVIAVYVVLGAIASIVLTVMVPVVVEQIIQLAGNLAGHFGDAGDYLGRFQTFTTEHGLSDNLRSSVASLQEGITNTLTSLFTTVTGFVGGIAALFIVLVLAFYMVVEEDTAKKLFRHLAPLEYQPYLAQLVVKMQAKIGAWLRGQILLGLIVGTAVFIGLSFIGVKYALLLGIIAGIFEIVPYVGPVVSIVPALIIGFADSPVRGLLVLGLYLVIQQIENNVLVPKIMQKVTGLNPIVSILALLVGIKLGGLVGAILAIPVATMVAVVLEDLFLQPDKA